MTAPKNFAKLRSEQEGTLPRPWPRNSPPGGSPRARRGGFLSKLRATPWEGTPARRAKFMNARITSR
jgi:hypothetical protein